MAYVVFGFLAGTAILVYYRYPKRLFLALGLAVLSLPFLLEEFAEATRMVGPMGAFVRGIGDVAGGAAFAILSFEAVLVLFGTDGPGRRWWRGAIARRRSRQPPSTRRAADGPPASRQA